MGSDAAIQTISEKAGLVGTVVQEMSGAKDAAAYAVDLMKDRALTTMTCPGLATEARDRVVEACAAHGMELVDPPLRDHMDRLDLALTWVDAGIADTGTLVLRSDSEDIRIATMMSRIHVAMLPVSKIRETAMDMAGELDAILKSDTASYTAFITGPSRTADIERVLAIGVHGPVELHLLLIKEA